MGVKDIGVHRHWCPLCGIIWVHTGANCASGRERRCPPCRTLRRDIEIANEKFLKLKDKLI